MQGSLLAWPVALRLAALAIASLSILSCGHTISGAVMPGGRGDFDFRSFTCDQQPSTPEADGNLQIRFLGISGLYLEWHGVGVLSAPFFSYQGLLSVGVGRGAWNQDAFDQGMAGVPKNTVAAILVGHSHHDHLYDVPLVASQQENAEIFANQTGVNILSSIPELAIRTHVLEDLERQWVWLTSPTGDRLPIRFMPILSPHAKQAPFLRWAKGEVTEPVNKDWQDLRLRSFKEGVSMAFVIDFMAEDLSEVAYRVYLQDAATESAGLAPVANIPELQNRPFDLAVLCIASYHLAKGFPEELIQDLKPRHVLVTHYRDFFRRPEKPIRFAPFLTDRRADRFLETVSQEVGSLDRQPLEFANPACGPAAREWTMPVPGELLEVVRFRDR